MFGLMELSRQRLRSSLIDRSFEKCNFCKGSGLILNSNSIAEQIIKTIKEKLSSQNKSEIYVKCNTILAEDLLNHKKAEIINLEEKYESKINFHFNSQYSMHDPIIDIDKLDTDIPKVKNKIIKKKTRISKNKTIDKNKVKTKKVKKQKVTADKKLDEDNDIENIKSSDISEEIVEEKTGWWS